MTSSYQKLLDQLCVAKSHATTTLSPILKSRPKVMHPITALHVVHNCHALSVSSIIVILRHRSPSARKLSGDAP